MEADFLDHTLSGIVLTKLKIKGIVGGKYIKTPCFKTFCESWLPKKYKNETTIRTYMNEVNKLDKFSPNTNFADIDYNFLLEYDNHLKESEDNKHNTRWKTMKFINTMFNDAIRQNCVKAALNPFKVYKRSKYEEPEHDELDLDHTVLFETLIFEKADTIPDILRRVLVNFLLMAYSRMRWSDATAFDPKEHVKDGRLDFIAKKFDVKARMKIYERLQKIIDIIPNNKINISVQAYNRWLKVGFTLVGLPEEMGHSHNGRHIFGATLAEAGVKKPKAAKLLGHRSVKSVDTYYHIRDRALDKAIDKIASLE